MIPFHWQHYHAPDQGQGISSLRVIFQNKMDSSWPILFFYPIRTWIFRALSLSSTVMAVTCIKSFQMLIWPILLWIQACILCLVIVSTQQPPLQIPQFGIVSSSQHFKDKYSGIPKQHEEPKEIEKLHSPEFWNTCNFQLFDGFLSKWGNHGAAAENNESTLDHRSANIEGRISKIHN